MFTVTYGCWSGYSTVYVHWEVGNIANIAAEHTLHLFGRLKQDIEYVEILKNIDVSA